MKNTILILTLVLFVNISSYSQNQDGEIKEYYSNGQIKEITNYKNGIKNGVYKLYLQNGVVYKDGVYRNGEKIGVWKEYYANKVLNIEYDYYKEQKKHYLPNGSLQIHYQLQFIHNNKIIDGGIKTTYDKDGAITGKTEMFNLLKSYTTYHSNGNLKQQYLYALIKDTIASINPNDFDTKQVLKITNPDIKNGLLTMRKVFYTSDPTISIDYDENGDFLSMTDFQLNTGLRFANAGKFEEAMPYFIRSLTCGNPTSNEYYSMCIFSINDILKNKLTTIEKNTKEYNEINWQIVDNLKQAIYILELYYYNYQDKTNKNTIEMMNYIYKELNIDHDLSRKIKSLKG